MASEYTRQDEKAQITIQDWNYRIEAYLDSDPLLHPELRDLLEFMVDRLNEIDTGLKIKLEEWKKENGR